MTLITTETTIGELVRTAPVRSRIFEKLGIDYCCGGKKTLAEVCRAKALDPTTVIAMLSALDNLGTMDLTYPDAMTLSELCDHIGRTHHDYLREELPRLDFMTRKVAAVHGEHEPRLNSIRRVFQTFAAEMVDHMHDEEENVFPRIRALESTADRPSEDARGLRAFLGELEVEHGAAGLALDQFRELTDNYTPPEWACNTFRSLYDALARLEKDMHQHVHKENNVLFPRALARIESAA